MVLVDETAEPHPIKVFETRATCLHHATTIKAGYTAQIHCGSIIQTAVIQSIDKEFFRSGETAMIRWRFQDNAEFIKEGSVVLFRDGRTKMIGVISKIFFEDEAEFDEEEEAKNSNNFQIPAQMPFVNT